MESSKSVKDKINEQFEDFLNRKNLRKLDFWPIFSYFRIHFSELNLKSFKKFDMILTRYQREHFSMLDDSEEDAYYLEIKHSEIYNIYKEKLIEFEYPLCPDSLYRLEDEFVDIIKRKITDDVTYYHLLEKLFYLSDIVDEKTIYIMHNILLFYQDVKRREPTYILGLSDLDTMYMSLKEKEKQKIKK